MADALGQEINQVETDKHIKYLLQFMPPSVDVTVRRGWRSRARDDSFHLIYLDGDHTYGAVAKDIKLARDGGIICGDIFNSTS